MQGTAAPKSICALDDALFWLGINADSLIEQISTSEILDAFNSSEMGTDLGPTERVGQIALNDQLLANLNEWARVLQEGLGVGFLDPAVSSGLRSSLDDLEHSSGTYSILQVRRRLDELNAPSTATTTSGIDYQALAALLELRLLHTEFCERARQ